ncbi:MAG: lipopolysaccharide biosynthesis protein [Hyphomicrobiaceae bacterium]|nr:lipopolysaccharide biosynthesis protein [Hyphomicrobiaceae bacterium]
MANQDLDVISLWSALRKGLLKLLVLTLIAGGATFGVLSLMAPRYTSEAQLAISSKITNPFPDAKSKGVSPDAVTPRLDREAINTHVKALMAPDLLLRVATKLGLEERPEFNSARGSVDLFSRVMRIAGVGAPRPGETDEDRVLTAVKQNLVVSAARESRFISIRFTSIDAALAAEFANALANAYRKVLVDVPVKETADVVKALTPKIEQLKREVLEAEAKAERFRAETDQFRSGTRETPVITQRISALNEELTKADAAASAAESKWVTARDLTRSGAAEVLPEVQSSPVIQGLIAQRVRLERQVFEAQASLLPAHPRMRQLNSDLRGLRRTIGNEVQKVVSSLEKSYRAAAIRVESIKRQLAQIKVKVVDTSGNEAKLKALESTAKSKRGELERLMRQVEDNRTLAATRAVPVEAQVVSTARAAAGDPTFPKKSSSMLLVMAGTMILGLAWMIARAVIMAGRPGGGAPLQPAGPQPSGVASNAARRLPTGNAKAAGATVAVASAGVAVAPPAAMATLKGIAQHLISRRSNDAGFRSLMASETDAIDPASEALSLAQELCDGGQRVILVDWSLDGKGCATEFGAAANQPGMMELLAGSTNFDDVILGVPDSDVHFIASGAAPQEAALALDPDSLNLVLDALDEAYDHIIVVGKHGQAQALFEAIQGRFDAGILVADARRSRALAPASDDTFLGFEVTDIDVIRFERSASSATASRRMQITEPAA